jgi:hypothetical protein
MVLDVLSRLRNQQPKRTPADLHGYVLAAIPVLSAIEAALPEAEQWTSLPDSEEGCRTLGDYLGLTRCALGLIA